MHKFTALLAVAALLLLPLAVEGHAPLRSGHADAFVAWQPPALANDMVDRALPTSHAGDAVPAVIGPAGALGATYLAASAYMNTRSLDGTGSSVESVARRAELMTVVAGLVTAPVGAHLGNRRRGKLATGVVRTAGVTTAASLLSLTLLRREEHRSPALYVAIPVSLVAAAAVTEVVTGR